VDSHSVFGPEGMNFFWSAQFSEKAFPLDGELLNLPALTVRYPRVSLQWQCGPLWAASSTAPLPPAECSSVESPFFLSGVTVRDYGPETIRKIRR
jgi:hypothetical protein